MKHSVLSMFLTKGILNRKLQHSSISGNISDDELEESEHLLKNVCARMPVFLVSELENACLELSCSKREFIESALTTALFEYSALAYEYDMTGDRAREANEDAYEEYLQEQIEKNGFNPMTGEKL